MNMSLGLVHLIEQNSWRSLARSKPTLREKSEKTDSLELLLINNKTRTDLRAQWQWAEDKASMRWHVR